MNQASDSIYEALSDSVCEAVILAFRELRDRGLPRESALRVATRVFAYHEPSMRHELACAIVESLASAVFNTDHGREHCNGQA